MRSVLAKLIFVVVFYHVNAQLYSVEEQKGLDELRTKADHLLYKPYMKSDFYLITFLRAKDLDVSSAFEMLRKAQEWRKSIKIDDLIYKTEEPWPTLNSTLPYRTDGVDKDGRPINEIPVGKWDTRKMVISGKGDFYTLHINKICEESFQKVRKINLNNPKVTQSIIIYDMSGYNTKQHACFACVPKQIQFVLDLEAYYPLRVKNIYIVNTPKVFEGLLNVLKSVMSKHTKEIIEVFGVDKREWSPVLYKNIDKSQLLPIFGGTKV